MEVQELAVIVENGFRGVDERLAQKKQGLDQTNQRLDRKNERLDRADERLDRVNERLDRVNERLDRTDGRLERLEERAANTDVVIAQIRDSQSWTAGEIARLSEQFTGLTVRMISVEDTVLKLSLQVEAIHP